MNNQFWGDERDFYKYALLRILAGGGDFSIGVCWMLTKCGKKGGGELAYLRNGNMREKDKDLFDFLRDLICCKGIRDVANMNGKIIPGAEFFADAFPTCESKRAAYWKNCIHTLQRRDLIFLDPDTGILHGEKDSKVKKKLDEYVQWDEVREIFNGGEHSLMMFQYFRLRFRNKEGEDTDTVGYDRRIRDKLSEMAGGKASVRMMWKYPVAYYFLIREAHKESLGGRIDEAVRKLGFCQRD